MSYYRLSFEIHLLKKSSNPLWMLEIFCQYFVFYIWRNLMEYDMIYLKLTSLEGTSMNILLFGVSNVGKSVSGKLLASHLNYVFYDLDEEVKKDQNMTY